MGNVSTSLFISKFTTDGVRLWGSYYNNGSDCRKALLTFTDALYVLAECDSSGNSTTAGKHQPTYGGGVSDCLILKISNTGNLIWSTYFGGNKREDATTIHSVNNNAIYMTGWTTSANGISTSGSHQDTINKTTSGSSFITKISSGGHVIWSTYLGEESSISYHYIKDMTIDALENIYVVGATEDTSRIVTTNQVHQTKLYQTNPVSPDAYIMKFDSSGKKIWGTYYGGNGHDWLQSIACDDSGYIYCAGRSTSSDSIATPGSYQTTNNFPLTGSNAFGNAILAKFDTSGKRIWGTYYGLSQLHPTLFGLHCNDGRLFMTSQLGSSAFSQAFITNDAYQKDNPGGISILITEFSTHGNRTWGSYFGGPGDEWGWNESNSFITSSSKNDIYFCGHTRSVLGLATPNSHQYYPGSQNTAAFNGYLAKFTWDTLVTIDEKVADTFCVGDRFSFSYRTTYPFKTNNTFTVQLSNSTGSFSSPVNIGSKTGTTTDTVFCTIPPNTPPGTKYRIRVIGNNIADTSLETTNEITINNLYPANLSASFNSSICPYDTLRLNSTTSSTGVKFSWTGPNNFADTGTAPIVDTGNKYGTGQYIVFANLNGCVGKDTVDVTFKPMPYSGTFNATASTPCETDTLFLNMTNAATGTTFSWTGPNSFTSTDQNTYITSATSTLVGQYIVRADLNGCIQKDTATLSGIKQLPVKPVATTNAPFCSGTALQLSATTTTPNATYQWNGPNGFTSTLQSPGIGAASPVHNGDYRVAATLNGCTTRDTVTVTIYPIPAKPTISSNAPLCAADTLRLFGNSTSTGVNYSWTGPNSFAGSAGDTAFKAPGTNATGQYKLTVEKDGCSSFDTMTLIVKPLPQAVSVSNNGPVCDGNTLLLNCGTSTNGSTYSWSGVGSFTANTQNTSITNAAPSASGWYYATVTLNGCIYKDSTNATINPIPAISGITASNPLCLGQNLQLNVNNISSATYSWAGPNGFTANIRNPQRNNLQYSDTGWYKLTATANNCISAPDSVRVALNPVPFVTIFGNKDTICPGGQAIFTALPNQSGAAPTFTWKVNSQTVASGNVFSTASLNNGDIISCEMTEYTKCNGPYTDPSNDVTITVMPWLTPSVSISASPTGPLKPAEFVTFTANPQNAGNNPGFQWKRNGADLVGAKGAIWSANTLNDNDSISVVLTSSYVCPQPASVHSNGIRVRILTGVDNKGNTTKLTLYPNPNNGKFILDGKLPDGLWQLMVVNSIGQVVYNTKVQADNGNIHTEISLPRVAAGTYLLRLQNEQGQYTARFGVE